MAWTAYNCHCNWWMTIKIDRQSQKLLDKYPPSSHKSNEICNLIVTREQSQTPLNYPRWKRWNSDWRIRRRWWCFHWSQNLTSTSITLKPYQHVLLVPKQVKRKNTNFVCVINIFIRSTWYIHNSIYTSNSIEHLILLHLQWYFVTRLIKKCLLV